MDLSILSRGRRRCINYEAKNARVNRFHACMLNSEGSEARKLLEYWTAICEARTHYNNLFDFALDLVEQRIM